MTMKATATVMAAALVMGTIGTASVYDVTSAAAKASIKKKTLEVKVGKTAKIQIKNKAKTASYTYKTSSKKIATVSKSGLVKGIKKGKAKITVTEKIKKTKKTRKIGVVKVKVVKSEKKVDNQHANINAPGNNQNNVNPDNTNQRSANPGNTNPGVSQPTQAPDNSQATQTPDNGQPTQTPVSEPTPTPDPYTKVLFEVEYDDTQPETVEGSTCTVDMQYFTGRAEGDVISGDILSGASDVKKTYKDGKIEHCQRYYIKGQDSAGKDCQIFIQDLSTEDDGKTIITKPVIFTNSEDLKWIEEADIEGKITINDDGTRTAVYKQREDSEVVPEIPQPVTPDNTLKYDKEIFTFYIGIGGSDEVQGHRGTITAIHFDAKGECENFNGKTVANGKNDCDTRFKIPGRVESLSARYILDGTDKNGNPCRMYVENNGVDNNGMTTEPTIITDSPDYAWVETAPLHGTVSWEKGLTIHMWTTADAMNGK